MEHVKKPLRKKFGTFKGVFVPSTEAILGTVLFLLLPALVLNVGLFMIIIIIILAHTITIATSFSLADCATNLNNVGSGGMYALSRRSLGKAFGGSIGIMLYFAQAASIAFYCIGFAEPLQYLLAPFFEKIGLFAVSGLTDQSIIATHILRQEQIIAGFVFIIFFIIALIGADFTLKIQTLILVILFLSISTIFVSPFLGLEFEGQKIFVENVGKMNLFGIHDWKSAAFIMSVFFLVFAQFFPAVTGIDAGVGMSGDLENPKKSLVTGTFTAIGVTFVVYLIVAFIFALFNKDIFLGTDGKLQSINLTILLGINKPFPFNIFGIMILFGILFATSSSALSCFMTAPRTLQSLAKDNILPDKLHFLKRDFKKGGSEPRFAVVVTFFIAFSVIIIGVIETAAMIVGICFLVVYGWVNISAFFERISGNPTFRPTSKGHWGISLYGFIMAIGAICLFNLGVGVAIIISQLILFQLILHFKSENKLEGVWWGVLFNMATKILKSLTFIVQGTKNWRPIISIISFAKSEHVTENLVKLGERIALNQGLVFMNVLTNEKDSVDDKKLLSNLSIPAQYIYLTSKDVTQGILSIIQCSHPGNIFPNSILMEYNSEVKTLNIARRSIVLGKNLFLLKNGNRLSKFNTIDIWWRGEKNGNLMVLLAYMINNSNIDKKNPCRIRIIRKLSKNDVPETAYHELELLLEKGRLTGEVFIIPYDEVAISDTIHRVSKNSDLIMVGLPGNVNTDGNERVFRVNEKFFENEIHKYDDMPAMFFVKSAALMNLIEDSTN